MLDGRRWRGMAQNRIAVIGGANVDIGGFVHDALRMRDSNIGTVRLSPGGVGRNIAENAVRLGLQTEFVGALGGDLNGEMLLADCRRKGIGTSCCLVAPQGRSCVYMFVSDERGDMCVAVNDMELQAMLTPAFFAERLDWINAMDAVVLEANLLPETLAFLAREIRVPLIADAVSAVKARRLMPALAGLSAIKPNRCEAEALTGVAVTDVPSARRAAQALMQLGVQRVYLTLGAEGALCTEAGRAYLAAAPVREIVNATGAGDAFTAAVAWAQAQQMPLEQCARAGMAASAIAALAAESVSPEMSAAAVRARMPEIEIQEL